MRNRITPAPMSRHLTISLLMALMLTMLCGCAEHTDTSQVPAGMAVSAPLTSAQVQTANQIASNRHAQQGNP